MYFAESIEQSRLLMITWLWCFWHKESKSVSTNSFSLKSDSSSAVDVLFASFLTEYMQYN